MQSDEVTNSAYTCQMLPLLYDFSLPVPADKETSSLVELLFILQCPAQMPLLCEEL